MTVFITYFVHGTTTDNEYDIATGWLQGELSAKGIQQCKELPAQIGKQKFFAVFCSDLSRAVESAKISFGGKSPIMIDARLRECNYGDWNGQKDDFKKYIQEYIQQPFPNGESYLDVEKRMREFLSDIKMKYDGKQIALVAHQAPQLALEVIVNHKSWKEAIDTDWRKIHAWQPGWKYLFE